VSIFASRGFRLLVSLGLLAVVIWVADWRAIWDVLRRVDPLWVACVAGFALLDRIVLTYRWDLLLVIRDVRLGFWKLFRVQLAANFLGSFLPSSLGVDAIRIAALLRSGLPATEVIATTLVDRASIVLATLLFGSATIIALAGTRLPGDLSWIVLVTTGAVVAICAAALQPRVRQWAAAVVVPRLPQRIRERVTEIARATLAYRHESRRLVWVALVTLGLLFVRLLFAKALALACGVDVPFADLLLVIPILWIVVMLPITVGGIGLQEAGYVGLMGLLGVPAAVAVSMSLIEHVVSRLVSLPGAFFLGDVTGAESRAAPR
jgi:uncharacterized protein (TIRG00374 family)